MKQLLNLCIALGQHPELKTDPNANLGGVWLMPASDEWNRDVSQDKNLPPTEMRVRSKVSDDTSKFTGAAKVILKDLKPRSMPLADNGGDCFIRGARDDRWHHGELLPIRNGKRNVSRSRSSNGANHNTKRYQP